LLLSQGYAAALAAAVKLCQFSRIRLAHAAATNRHKRKPKT